MIQLLAQEAAPANESIWTMLVLFGPPVLLLFILQTVFGRNDVKERAAQEEMVSKLNKNDAVVTTGGILGTFVSYAPEKKEVTIKVDDNTRLKVLASSIRMVQTSESK